MKPEIKQVKVTSYKDKVLDECADQIEAALEEIGMRAQFYAGQTVAVDSGRLRASINYATVETTGEGLPLTPSSDVKNKNNKPQPEDKKPRGKPKERTVVIGTNVNYAEIIEKRGGFKNRGKHYLRNAMADHVSEYKKILISHLDGN